MTNDEPDPRWDYLRVLWAEYEAQRTRDQIAEVIGAVRAWDPALLESPGGRRLNDLLCLAAGLVRKLGSAGRTFERGSLTDAQALDRDLNESISKIAAEWALLRRACSGILAARKKVQAMAAEVDLCKPAEKTGAAALADTSQIPIRPEEVDTALRGLFCILDQVSIENLVNFEQQIEASFASTDVKYLATLIESIEETFRVSTKLSNEISRILATINRSDIEAGLSKLGTAFQQFKSVNDELHAFHVSVRHDFIEGFLGWNIQFQRWDDLIVRFTAAGAAATAAMANEGEGWREPGS